MYKNIAIADIKESKTNPRRSADDAGLNDLAASIKEKGVLVPIIVRPHEKNGHDSGRYELVAGSRRVAAATKAGLKEIPASIRELTDDEAREVQIVENLQREDVHPLEEAAAYKALIREAKDIAAVAAKVGKPAAYVRARLNLVQLGKEAAAAYREGKINDGHAAEIANLSDAGDQQKAVAWIRQESQWGVPPVKKLKEWIEEEFSTFLANQPWLKDVEALAAVGPCKECPKNTSTLFGDLKAGECVSVKCWRRKMDAFLKWKLKQNPGSVLVALDWESARNEKGALSTDKYQAVGKKKCESAVVGVVAGGSKAGTTIAVCVNAKCKVHRKTDSYGGVPLTPEEKAKRKKEKDAEKAAKAAAAAKAAKVTAEILAGVAWPPSAKDLEVVFAGVMASAYGDFGGILGRRNITVKERHKYTSEKAEEAVRKLFKDAATQAEKFQIVLELTLEKLEDEDLARLAKK